MSEDLLYQLEQSKESLAFALESARMGTWDIDLATNTVHCSVEMLKLWGVKPQDFDGSRETLKKKVHPDDVQLMSEAIDKAIEGNGIYELEYRILPAPGVQRWVLSRGRCTFAPNSKTPTRLSGVVFDVTDRREAMEEREQFLTIASHELRTPLTILQLQLLVMEQRLRELPPDDPAYVRLFEDIQKQKIQLQRMVRIVDNIFEQSNVLSGQFRLHRSQFDLVRLAEEVVERFEGAKSGRIEFKKSEPKLEGSWDQFRIEQVLINLMTNAIRFGDKKPISLEVGRSQDRALIIVQDQGIGIPDQDRERIFERFTRSSVDYEQGGMGLGLFLAKNIVEGHGGSIQVRSLPGRGSEFTVHLPFL